MVGSGPINEFTLIWRGLRDAYMLFILIKNATLDNGTCFDPKHYQAICCQSIIIFINESAYENILMICCLISAVIGINDNSDRWRLKPLNWWIYDA